MSAAVLLIAVVGLTVFRQPSSTPGVGEPRAGQARSTKSASTQASSAPTPRMSTPSGPVVQTVLRSAKVRTLTRWRTRLPARLDIARIRATATPLVRDPVRSAIAVVQQIAPPGEWQKLEWSGIRVYVLGDDARWRWLGATRLGFSGPATEEALLIGQQALSPDGTQLAVSDETRSRLVVADLTTGRIRFLPTRFPAPLSPTWTPDGTGLLTQDRMADSPKAVRIDIGNGRASPFPHNIFGTGFAPDGRPISIEVARGGGLPRLRHIGPDGKPALTQLELDTVDERTPWLRKDLAVQRTYNELEVTKFEVVVFDPVNGRALVRLLGRRDHVPMPAGWITDQTLLLQEYPTGNLFAWTYTTGGLRLVSEGGRVQSSLRVDALTERPRLR